MVLGGRPPGRVGRRRDFSTRAPPPRAPSHAGGARRRVGITRSVRSEALSTRSDQHRRWPTNDAAAAGGTPTGEAAGSVDAPVAGARPAVDGTRAVAPSPAKPATAAGGKRQRRSGGRSQDARPAWRRGPRRPRDAPGPGPSAAAAGSARPGRPARRGARERRNTRRRRRRRRPARRAEPAGAPHRRQAPTDAHHDRGRPRPRRSRRRRTAAGAGADRPRTSRPRSCGSADAGAGPARAGSWTRPTPSRHDRDRETLRILAPGARRRCPTSPSVRELTRPRAVPARQLPRRGEGARGVRRAHRLGRPAPGAHGLLPGAAAVARVEELWAELAAVSPSPELVTEGRIVLRRRARRPGPPRRGASRCSAAGRAT